MGLFKCLRDLQPSGESTADSAGGGLVDSHGHRWWSVWCAIWQWRIFICDLPEQPFAQGGGAGHAERADQLQHGRALESVPDCRRICRFAVIDVGGLPVAGDGPAVVVWAQADDAAVL